MNYNPETLELHVTQASGQVSKFSNVLSETFESFSNSETPYLYFLEEILGNDEIGKL